MACSKFRCPGWAMEPERARITIRHPFATFPRDVNCLGRSSSTFRDGAIRPHGPRSLSTAEPAIFWMGDDPTGAWPRIPRLAFRVRRDVVPWWDFATGIGCRRQRCRLGRVRSSRGRLRITGLKPTYRSLCCRGLGKPSFPIADNPGAIREAPLSISRALRGQSEAVVSR
jgi:hypothetical protein